MRKAATTFILTLFRRLGLEVRRIDQAQEKLFRSPAGDTGKEIAGRDEIVADFLMRYDFESILDLGCGKGALFAALTASGKNVTGVDILPPESVETKYGDRQVRYVCEDLMHFFTDRQFDAVLSSHVVEHLPDTASFLNRFFSFLRPEGAFCIIWPPPKSELVGGHVNLFTMGHLVYNVVRLGVDCGQARMVRCKYSLGLMGNYRRFDLPKLGHDQGDIELLADRFPFLVRHGSDAVSPLGIVEL